MSTIFLFHGVGGSVIENWLPWMTAELEQAGHRVIVPTFPHSLKPKLEEWVTHLEPYKDQIPKSILVGHSIGGAFSLRLLERWQIPVRATFLVASVSGVMGNVFDPVITTFTVPPYDWTAIKKCGGSMHVIHADNDPYITLKKAEALAKNLGIAVELIPGGKHLNTVAGYRKFPRLRDDILREIVAETP